MDYASLHACCVFQVDVLTLTMRCFIQGYIYMSVFTSQYPGSPSMWAVDEKQDIKLLWP